MTSTESGSRLVYDNTDQKDVTSLGMCNKRSSFSEVEAKLFEGAENRLGHKRGWSPQIPLSDLFLPLMIIFAFAHAQVQVQVRDIKYVLGKGWKTSQELQMLSSVTIDCQVTMIVMN